MGKLSPLLPERHPQQDFFIADIFDSLPFKDDVASMEYPLFTLSTKPDKRALDYVHGPVSIQVQPSFWGLPTIFDKDILLYCGSQVMERMNRGETPHRRMRISLHDLLIATNRDVSGHGYRLIKNSLNRLTGSLIKTNIKTGHYRQEGFFHLLDSAQLIESERFKGRLVAVEITLSEWYYNSLIARQVLTIDRDYFRLRKSIDRRLYEIARKHCGHKKHWSIQLKTLWQKSGSRSALKKFRLAVKQLEQQDHLPEYRVKYDSEGDKVKFISRTIKADKKPAQEQLVLPPAEIPPELAEEGKALCGRADVYALWDEWQLWNQSNGKRLQDWRRAFLGFCRKRGDEQVTPIMRNGVTEPA
ncbi:hypothetical protein AB833_07955 [Chromatiales bacterium (ex Bugula neritina AB1)]|nr:hypothetical protein AB833_07955 [Chromatiales bacterium (ex Bugula neritina AB1)]